MPLSSLLLAAQCCGLKSMVAAQQTRISAQQNRIAELQESARRDSVKIAALIARNRQLTSALHRTACAG